MEAKKSLSKSLRAYFITFPAILVSVLALAVILLRLVFESTAWLDVMAWAAAGLAAVNPGAFLLLIPLLGYLSKAPGGYIVAQAVTMEGVGRDTLDRCAAIAEAKATHPIAACLRAFCGDVAAPPDKFVEMEGLGASAQFSNQLIHAGSAEYMRGLKIETPDVPGRNAFITLEGRLLGYYNLLGPSESSSLKTRLIAAAAACAALKIAVWVTLALTGTDYLTVFVGCETVSLVVGLMAARRLF
ncbi:MAG: hypothetical protein LBI19_02755 [Oscillospiraceae bacterium]|jgi:hypothetical protein|nr:hypothetical protein [Oscillospiraceae bacterium]